MYYLLQSDRNSGGTDSNKNTNIVNIIRYFAKHDKKLLVKLFMQPYSKGNSPLVCQIYDAQI